MRGNTKMQLNSFSIQTKFRTEIQFPTKLDSEIASAILMAQFSCELDSKRPCSKATFPNEQSYNGTKFQFTM